MTDVVMRDVAQSQLLATPLESIATAQTLAVVAEARGAQIRPRRLLHHPPQRRRQHLRLQERHTAR
jgi:hypothetical protein